MESTSGNGYSGSIGPRSRSTDGPRRGRRLRRAASSAMAVLMVLGVLELMPGRPASAQTPTAPFACVRDGLLLGSWVPCDYGTQPPDLLNAYLLSSGRLGGSLYSATAEQREALDRMQDQAVSNTVARFGLPASDADAVKSWGRNDALVELWALLAEAIETPAADRSEEQALAVEWFTAVAQRQGVEVAEAAGLEYLLWAGLDRSAYRQLVDAPGVPSQSELSAALSGEPVNFAGTPPSSGFCVYDPPAGFTDYTGQGHQSCFTPCLGFGCGAPTPTFEQFKNWGAGRVNERLFFNQDFALVSRDVAMGLALAGAVAYAGFIYLILSTTLSALLTTTAGIGAALTSVFPFATTAAIPASLVPAGAVVPSAAAVGGAAVAASLAAAVAIAIVAVAIAVIGAIQVFDAAAVPAKLAELVVKSHSQVPDLPSLLDSPDRTAGLLALFIGSTLPGPQLRSCDNLATIAIGADIPASCLNPPPIPAPAAGDPLFEVTPQGSPQTTTSRWIDVRDEVAKTTSRTRIHDTWFVHDLTDQNGASITLQSLRLRFTDWDGDQRTAWLVENPPNDPGWTFIQVEDRVTEIDDLQTCHDVGACATSSSIQYLGPDGGRYSARVVPAPPPPPDVTAPVLSFTPIASPSADPVSSVRFALSEAMVGNPSFRLTLDGIAVVPVHPPSALVGQALDKSSWGVPVDAARPGTWVFTVVTAGFTDGAGNPVAGGDASISWIQEPLPTAAFGAVESPRTDGVDEVEVFFSEPVTGVDADDFRLRRDGQFVSMTGVTVQGSGASYTLSGLGPSTSEQGDHELFLPISTVAPGIANAAGRPLAHRAGVAASVSFSVDLVPTVSIDPVTPAVRNSGVEEVTVRFSEPVTGFTHFHVAPTWNGLAVINDFLTVTPTADPGVYTVGGFGPLTMFSGDYVVRVATGGIEDLSGQPLAAEASVGFQVDTVAPTATILSPAAGTSVAPGAALTFNFACVDVGSGLAGCNGSQGNGTALPTGSEGTFTVEVTALDRAGNTSTTSRTYEVTSTPPTTEPPTTEPGPRRAPVPGDGYFLVELDGDVHAFGAARALLRAMDPTATENDAQGATVSSLLRSRVGASAVVAVESTADGRGLWVLLTDGRILTLGTAPAARGASAAQLSGSVAGRPERPVALARLGNGDLWVFTTAGRIIPQFGQLPAGAAAAMTQVLALDLAGPILDATPTRDGSGAYATGSDGGVFAYNAPFHGSVPGALATLGRTRPDQPVVAMAADPDDTGYWLVGADGGVFAFAAPFRGALPAVVPFHRLAAPINGMTAFGDGYLLVAGDGGMFNFSDRPFAGSAHGLVDTTIVAITPT